MVTYKKLKQVAEVLTCIVKIENDKLTIIPLDNTTAEYSAFQQWLAQGNILEEYNG